jgi:1-acyl-sn-glycerol-3-phosphate acyltransferase
MPPLVPRRGNAFSHQLWQGILHSHGWTVTGEIPNVPKAMVIAAPHTSNMDGWYCFMAIMSLGINITVMAKDSLFKPPFKSILHWLNVIPVKRSSPEGFIDQVVAEYQQRDQIWMAMSPEGTRNSAPKWKSGFYRIAVAANIPLVIATIDYAKRQITLKNLFYPTGNYEQDLPAILEYYRGIQPYNPDQLSLPLKQLK